MLHISNDVSVEALMGDGFDRCPNEAGSGRPSAEVVLSGEILAPARALYQAREARGQRARAELHQLAGEARFGFHHFRLCKGERRYPLGWHIGDRSADDMARQAELLLGRFGKAP